MVRCYGGFLPKTTGTFSHYKSALGYWNITMRLRTTCSAFDG